MTPIFLPEEDENEDAPDSAGTDIAEVDAVDSVDPEEVVDAPDPGDPDEELPVETGLDLEIDLDLPQEPAAAVSQEPLLDLQSAIERVPAGLREEMEQVLRAEFREVIRWKAPK